MNWRKFAAIAVAALLVAPAGLFARQAILTNGSMELGPGQGGLNPFIVGDWTEFFPATGNVERSGEANRTPGGSFAIKAFADTTNSTAGERQELVAQPGDVVTFTGWLYTKTGDKLGGTGQAGLRMSFHDGSGVRLDYVESLPFDSTATADTWTQVTVGPLTAPAGTVKVRVECKLKYTIGDVSGALFWDDMVLTGATGGDVLNGDIEDAGVSTEPNPWGIEGWFGFEDQQKSDDVSLDGDWSLKLGVTKAYSGLVQEMGFVQDGDVLRLQAYVLNPASDPLTGNSRVGIKLEFAAETEVPPPEENLAFDENAPTNSWQLVALDTTVPAGSNLARITLIYTGDALTTGMVFFDAVSAQLGTPPGANQLENASFESGAGGQNGIDDWTEFNTVGTSQAELSCDLSYSGSCAMLAMGQAYAGIYQAITVTPGQALHAQVYMYTPQYYKLTGPAKAGIKVEWFSGTLPPQVDIGDPESSPNTKGASADQDTWIPLSIDYTVPPGTAGVAKFVCIIEKGNAGTGRAYFDNCEAVVTNRVTGADADADYDEDLYDFSEFQRCYTGEGVTPLAWNCLVFDQNADNDVDRADYVIFQGGLTGPQ